MKRRLVGVVLVVSAGCASQVPPADQQGDGSPRASWSPSDGEAVAPPPSGLSLSPLPSPSSTVIPALDDAEEVADELIRAEEQIRFPGTARPEFVRLGRVQQAALRKLVANPSFRQTALDKAPRDLRPVIQANIRAGEQLSSLTRPVTQVPAWRIIQPPPAEELRGYYADAEREFGIPWQYLAAIHLVETRMGRIRGTSTAGAQGPMQFIPSTWAAYGKGDINDPKDAIAAAARYLKASGAPAAMGRALYAYNHSQKYVDAVTAYAGQMQKHERTYLAFYEWQVYVKTTSGDVLLEVGYGA